MVAVLVGLLVLKEQFPGGMKGNLRCGGLLSVVGGTLMLNDGFRNRPRVRPGGPIVSSPIYKGV